MNLVLVLIFAVLVVVAFLIIKSRATSVQLPHDPNAFVPAELRALVGWLAEQAETQTGHPVKNNPLARSALAEAAQLALKEADDNKDVEISVPALVHGADGAKPFKVTVTRDQLRGFDILPGHFKTAAA